MSDREAAIRADLAFAIVPLGPDGRDILRRWDEREAELAAAREREAKLREALRWYAEGRWNPKIARRALADGEGET